MKLILLLLLLPVSLAAFNFGLTTSQYGGFSNNLENDTSFEYRGDILPHLSFFFGETGTFFASAAMTIVSNDDDTYYIPELLRTEIFYRSGTFGIRAGRMNYSDPLGFIANGLFDGLQITHTSPLGRFGLGAWYTGLLYKKNTRIGMTAEERLKNNEPLDFDNFADTYFSSPRLLAALDWEHPSVAETLRLQSSFIAQFDLRDSDTEEKINTQYFTIKAALPLRNLLIEAGAGIQLAQTDAKASSETNDIYAAFAWNFGLFRTLPTSFNSRLALTGNFAGGKVSDSIGAFIPITSTYKNSGSIFQPILTGMTVLGMNYTARFTETAGASLSTNYYIRNDLVTGNIFYIEAENKGYFLGPEIFANVIWNPFSDLQFILGAGIFIPALGNVWDDLKPQWRAELTAIFAIY